MDRVPHGPNPDGVPSGFKRSSRTISGMLPNLRGSWDNHRWRTHRCHAPQPVTCSSLSLGPASRPFRLHRRKLSRHLAPNWPATGACWTSSADWRPCMTQTERFPTYPTEAIDRARHAAAVKCLHHLAPDQNSGLRTLRGRLRPSPRPRAGQRTSVRGRT